MATIRVTKEFSFEMAHALRGYDGLCSQIHGHSYKLFVTVVGEPQTDPTDPKLGMVIDFGVLKKRVNTLIVERYDHSLVIQDTERNHTTIDSMKLHFERVITTDYQPTCENMIADFAQLIRQQLPVGVALHSLRLHETATSFAEWFASDNK